MDEAVAPIGQRQWQQTSLVTIITPVYNGEPYLDEVIRSVQDQDYPNVEHIVLDDGSTDGTLETIKRYDDKIRWESHENMGEARTVNKGFSMAHGEILAAVNSDDPLLPGAITAIVEHLLARPDALVAYPDWLLIDGNGNTIQKVVTHDYDYLNMLRWHHCLPGPGTFFRRNLIEQTGGRDPSFRYANDFDFWLRAGLLGPFIRVPKTLATFRYHAGARSASDLGKLMAEEHLRMTDKVFATPNLPPETLEVKDEAYSSAYYIAGTQCGADDFSAKRRYFLRAIWLAPLKSLIDYRHRWRLMLPAFLGRPYILLRRAVGRLYRLLPAKAR